jgi:aconitate hydratase
VQKAKDVKILNDKLCAGSITEELQKVFTKINSIAGMEKTMHPQPGNNSFLLGSAIFAKKPGDGSAREQAASCQRVLGASANFALEYATKRYRSNLINWGILPFLIEDEKIFAAGDFVFFPNIKKAVLEKSEKIKGYVLGENTLEITAALGGLTDAERQILIEGCLINYYAQGK